MRKGTRARARRPCKSERGWRPREDGVQSSEYGVRSTKEGGVAKAVQRCKTAYGRCKSGKVKSEDRVRITDYGVRSAGGARERQRAPTGSDTFRMPNEVRPHGALGWHAVPTLPEAERQARSARSADPTSLQANPTSLQIQGLQGGGEWIGWGDANCCVDGCVDGRADGLGGGVVAGFEP